MEDLLILSVRIVNAAAWTVLAWAFITDRAPALFAVRALLIGTIAVGMWMLVIGGLVPFGIEARWARLIYTAYTTISCMVAFGVLTGQWKR